MPVSNEDTYLNQFLQQYFAASNEPLAAALNLANKIQTSSSADAQLTDTEASSSSVLPYIVDQVSVNHSEESSTADNQSSTGAEASASQELYDLLQLKPLQRLKLWLVNRSLQQHPLLQLLQTLQTITPWLSAS